MAIDYNAGINSIDVGAHDITYSGNEGPKSPEQEKLMGFDDTPGFELEPLEKLLDEYREDNNGRDPVSIDDLRRFFYTKYGPKGIAKVEQAVQQQEQQAQMQQRGGIQMASAADPMLQEEYDKYVFEMQEIGQEPMSLEQFRQEAVAGMATGGRAGYASGQLVKPGPGRPGYKGDDYDYGGVYSSSSSSQSSSPTHHGGGGADASTESFAKSAYAGDPKGYENVVEKYGVRDDDTGRMLTEAEKRQSIKEGPNKVQAPSPKKEKEPPVIKTVWDHLVKQKTANAKKYIAYLRSQGAAVPDWLAALDEEDAPKYLTEEQENLLNYGWSPENPQWDPIMQKNLGITPHALGPMSYGDWKASGLDPTVGTSFNILASGDVGNLRHLKNPGTVINPKTGLPFSDLEWDMHLRSKAPLSFKDDHLPKQYGPYTAPLEGTLPPTTDPTPDPDIPTGPIEDGLGGIDPAHQAILKNIYGGTLPTMFAADGGRAGYAGGGIADLRQGYFLGKIVKSITKPFKGAIRSVKKIAKSPAGKMAIAAALMGAPFGGGSWFGTGSGWGKLSGGLGSMFGGAKLSPGALGGKTPGLGGWLSRAMGSMRTNPFPWIAGASALGGLYTAMGDDDEDEMYKKWLADKAAADAYWTPRFDQSNFRRITSADGGRIGYAEGGDKGRLFVDEDTTVPLTEFEKDLRWTDKDTRSDMYYELLRKLEGMSDEEKREFLHYGPQPYGSGWGEMVRALEYTDDPVSEDYYEKGEHYAQGGRTGYAGGGYNDDDEEEDNRVAALRAMYGMRRNAQEGGLMDLGGMEKDYRNEGGFVPIGGQERADDVPARLSKNEFVFTADAVRNAGGGDIDKGAEIMENLMENLEQGGKVSEESQGLEGARDMFATSQRLEGVL